MKKILLFAAAAVLISGTMVSCAKSTKGKMAGEWNLDSMSSTVTSISGGNTSTSSTTISGSAITQTSTSGGSTTTTAGVLNTGTFTINKDGTWDRVMSTTFTGTGYSSTQAITTSGNWDFAKGVGEFKKNERVIFSTLKENTNSTDIFGGITTTSTSSDSYLDGENTEVFVITESKKKSLTMESKGSNTSLNSAGGSSTYTQDTKISLSL